MFVCKVVPPYFLEHVLPLRGWPATPRNFSTPPPPRASACVCTTSGFLGGADNESSQVLSKRALQQQWPLPAPALAFHFYPFLATRVSLFPLSSQYFVAIFCELLIHVSHPLFYSAVNFFSSVLETLYLFWTLFSSIAFGLGKFSKFLPPKAILKPLLSRYNLYAIKSTHYKYTNQ